MPAQQHRYNGFLPLTLRARRFLLSVLFCGLLCIARAFFRAYRRSVKQITIGSTSADHHVLSKLSTQPKENHVTAEILLGNSAVPDASVLANTPTLMEDSLDVNDCRNGEYQHDELSRISEEEPLAIHGYANSCFENTSFGKSDAGGVTAKRIEKAFPIQGFDNVAHGQFQNQAVLSNRSDKSVRSDSSQRIIDDLQGQIQALQSQVALQARKTPRSARSDRSSGSVRSETSQRIIDDLQGQILTLQSQLQSQASKTPRSARSEKSNTSQHVIDTLHSQIEKLQTQLDKTSSVPCEDADEVKVLLRDLKLPLEYENIFSDEGIELLDDLQNYGEAELIALGCKRAHAKRLLNAAALKLKNDDVG